MSGWVILISRHGDAKAAPSAGPLRAAPPLPAPTCAGKPDCVCEGDLLCVELGVVVNDVDWLCVRLAVRVTLRDCV